ncbi:MAG: RDD family protein [Candidatus Hodarchaeota archaeon]
MLDEQLVKRVDCYIKEIARLLPYRKEKKQPVLDALREEVMEAMQDSEETDPTIVYGEPREVAKNVSSSQEWGIDTSYKRRALAYIIDMTLVTVTMFGPTLLAFLIFLDLLVPGFAQIFIEGIFSTNNDPILASLATNLFVTIILLAFSISSLISPIYFIIFEILFSSSTGKKILGLKVCDASGIKITPRQSIIRNFSKFSILLLILDIIIGKYTKAEEKNRRILDVIAESMVIKV